jgi:ribosomal protein S27E
MIEIKTGKTIISTTSGNMKAVVFRFDCPQCGEALMFYNLEACPITCRKCHRVLPDMRMMMGILKERINWHQFRRWGYSGGY